MQWFATAGVLDSQAFCVVCRHTISLALLNANPDNVRREAQLIAKAGMPGRVTIATNMAGRGTDILLGGNPKGLTHALLMMLWAHWHLEGALLTSGELLFCEQLVAARTSISGMLPAGC